MLTGKYQKGIPPGSRGELKGYEFLKDELTDEERIARVAALQPLAEEMGATLAQLSLAWVLAQDPNFVPIPGTKHVCYVEENAAAADLKLSDEDLQRASELFHQGAVLGDRYAQSHMISLDAD